VVEGAYTFESGLACAEVLLAKTPRPTAIFAATTKWPPVSCRRRVGRVSMFRAI
jgi:hypothetical protein